jgi:hypothetical protein
VRVLQRFELGDIALRQISIAVVIGPLAATAAATAAEAGFERVEQQLGDVLQSLRPCQ